MNSRIPFLNLPDLHAPLKEELLAVIADSLSTASFIGGPQVTAFEEEFADFCETSHCIGVGSGTDALRFALLALGVGSGDAVITVPNTFIATTEAISQVGADIVFVDVKPDTLLMDPSLLEAAIENSEKPVKAIIPVHLYGQIADMDEIMAIASKHDAVVVEDAAQAHGATYKGQKAGSIGDAAAFSFYPGKNLGACGEAGAVVTNNSDIAAKVASLRDHGQKKKYHHDMEGYNGRLDAIQAGVLRIKLKHLNAWNESRQTTSDAFDAAFSDFTKVRPVAIASDNTSARHLYVVHTENREALAKHLDAQGIDSALHYPVPLHRQPCYRHLNLEEGSFPVAEKSAATLLSLPMFPMMPSKQASRIIEAVTLYENH